MKWTTRLTLAACFLLLASWLLFRCGRQNKEPMYETKIQKDGGFQANIDREKGTIVITQTVQEDRRGLRNGTSQKANRQNEPRSEVVELPRRATIAYDDKTHQLSVTAPKAGLVFEPGLSCLSAEDGLRLGIDVQWGFYGRWGAIAGLSGKTGSTPNPRFYAAVTFQPFKQHLTNTSLLVGIDNRKDIQVGVRVSF